MIGEGPPHPRPLSPKGERGDRAIPAALSRLVVRGGCAVSTTLSPLGERVARDAAFFRRRGTGEGVRLEIGMVVTTGGADIDFYVGAPEQSKLNGVAQT